MRRPAGVLAVVAVVLLAGCSDGPRFEPDHQEASAQQENFPGLLLTGTLDAAPGKVTVHALARNHGPLTFRVSAYDCDPPWSHGMEGKFGPVYPLGPQFVCHPLGKKDFPPGAELPLDLEWDGRLWIMDDERFEDAPPATYTWTLAFEAGSRCIGDQCEVNDWVRLRFTVVVE